MSGAQVLMFPGGEPAPTAAERWAIRTLEAALKTDLQNGWGEAIGLVQAHQRGHLTHAELAAAGQAFAERLLTPDMAVAAEVALEVASCPFPAAEVLGTVRGVLAGTFFDLVKQRAAGLPDCSARVLAWKAARQAEADRVAAQAAPPTTEE